MNQDYNNPAFKKLLQKLQEESWQLELLISGFAIFGLFTAYEPLNLARIEARHDEQIYYWVTLFIAQISCIILIINLLIHVLLRGLWIGALGLRYVSGDIDYNYLNYSSKFTRYLKKKVGSFDRYIAQLEDYCSIIFAVSFLLIFYVIAIALVIVSIALIAEYIIDNGNLPEAVRKIGGGIMVVFIVLGMLLTFFDFITQGLLKKRNWISKLYFPFYWVFSFLTLSFLYRPLVYNFLDNKFGKRLSFLLIPIGLLLFFTLTLSINKSNYFSSGEKSNTFIANNDNYEDSLDERLGFIDKIAIQSKVIREPYIKVIIPYTKAIEDRMFKNNPGLKPKNDLRGMQSEISFTSDGIDWRNRDSLQRAYLKTFNSTYYIDIDSLNYKSDFIVSNQKNEDFGFEAYYKTDSILEGKHILTYFRYAKKNSDSAKVVIKSIPFWIFRDKNN